MSINQILFVLLASCLIAISFAASDVKFVQVGNTSMTPLKLECSIQRKGRVIKTIDIMDGSHTTIASINREISEEVSYQKDNFIVEGKLHLETVPHLKVTWPFPTSANAGHYTCQISAVVYDRRVVYVSKIMVTFKETTFADLLKVYRIQASEIEQIIRNTSEEIAALKAELSNSRRIVQQGVVICGSSVNYTALPFESSGDKCREQYKESHTVNFPKLFSRTPSISLSVLRVDVQIDKRLGYFVTKDDENPRGFILTCGSWCGTQINEFEVQWLARIN